jgi:hypothetical protein
LGLPTLIWIFLIFLNLPPLPKESKKRCPAMARKGLEFKPADEKLLTLKSEAEQDLEE